MMSKDLKGQARREYWQTQIEAWELSGHSQREFCRAHELNYPQFAYWRRKLRQRTNASSGQASSGFVTVLPSPAAATCDLSLVLPNGIEVRGVEASNLEVVLRLLGRLS